MASAWFCIFVAALYCSATITTMAQDHGAATTAATVQQTGATTQASQSDPMMDTCVENAKKGINDNLGRNYPQFQNLTNNLTAPREFYQKLFNTTFTKDTYLQYCNAYKTSRAELDKCSNSTARNLALLQYSFVDYVCVKRENEYADAIQCLQNLNNDATVYTCRTSKCAVNEQNSINAKNPPANATRVQLMDYAVGDCLYTRCIADCRKTAIEKTCGNEKSELELEALRMALSSADSISQTFAALKMSVSNALQDVFPKECRDASSMPLRIFAAAGSDYLGAAVNGTFNLLQSIQNSSNLGGMSVTTVKHSGANGQLMIGGGFVASMAMGLVMAMVMG